MQTAGLAGESRGREEEEEGEEGEDEDDDRLIPIPVVRPELQRTLLAHPRSPWRKYNRRHFPREHDAAGCAYERWCAGHVDGRTVFLLVGSAGFEFARAYLHGTARHGAG